VAAEADPPAAVTRRIRIISAGAYVVFIIPAVMHGGRQGFFALTCTAAVTMINFLWLEQIVNAVLQPSPRLRAWKLLLRSLARYALLGAAISVAIFVVHFDALSVLLGFSILVVGIMGEALVSVVRSFAD
jgi:hypothetical protein